MNVTSLYWRQLYLYLQRERRRQMRARLRRAADQVEVLSDRDARPVVPAASGRSGVRRRSTLN